MKTMALYEQKAKKKPSFPYVKFNYVVASLIIVTLFVVNSNVSIFAEEIKSLIRKKALSLEDCIEIAKSNNPMIVQAKNDLDKYKAKLKQKYSSYYPQIDLYSSHSQSETSGTDITTKQYSHSIELGQDIYKGGKNSAEIKEARANLVEKQSEYEKVKLDEIFELKNTYYQILKVKHLSNVYRDIAARRKTNADLIRLLYKAGREKRANLLRAEAETAKAELNLSQAEDNLITYKLKLNKLMGRILNAPLQIKRKLQKVETQMSLEELLNYAQENHPELKQLQAKIRAARANLKESRSGLLPNLSLSAGYSRVGEHFSTKNESWNWNTKIKLSLPIFDGFLAFSQIREAEIEIENLQIEYDDLQKEIAIEVNEAYLNLLNAQRKFEVAQQALEAAQEKADLSRLEYKQGAISYRSLDTDESILTAAEFEYVDALYNVSLAKAELDNTQGK